MQKGVQRITRGQFITRGNVCSGFVENLSNRKFLFDFWWPLISTVRWVERFLSQFWDIDSLQKKVLMTKKVTNIMILKPKSQNFHQHSTVPKKDDGSVRTLPEAAHLRNNPRENLENDFHLKIPWNGGHFGIILMNFQSSTNWTMPIQDSFTGENAKIPLIQHTQVFLSQNMVHYSWTVIPIEYSPSKRFSFYFGNIW